MKSCFTPQAKVFWAKTLHQLSLFLIFTLSVNLLTARTYYVTYSGDSGTGSLRHALNLAANSPGEDIIEFSIGSGVQYLELSQPLFVPSGVFIDGMSQPGYTGLPLIHFIGTGYLRIENVEEVVVESLDLSETESKYAIWMKNVENCSVYHSNLSGHEYGIYSEAENVGCHLIGNRFYGCTYGVYAEGFHQNMMLTDNDFAGITKSGIYSTENLHAVMGDNSFHQSVPINQNVKEIQYVNRAESTVEGISTNKIYSINTCSLILLKNGNGGDYRLDLSGKADDEVEYLLVHPSGKVEIHGKVTVNDREQGRFHVSSDGYQLYVKNKGKVILIEVDD